MAESASAEGSCPGRPVRGILKKTTSTPKSVTMESEVPGSGIRWDEINIMMTEHPEGKDYGHMKINEPKTPYHEKMSGDDDDEDAIHGVLCADALAEKVLEARENTSTKHWGDGDSSGGSECSDDEELSEEAKEHKKKFKEWRKRHYNEYQAVQRARDLIKQDDEEEELEQPEQMQF